jgi:indolepyruvate ferredoxin oxidoreductase alpha subunit
LKQQIEQNFLLGNEAIARGAIEANVDFVAGYPGTPSSEILETLARDAVKYSIYVEWSTNEMVAFENALGASLAGLRAMVTMKHAGLNWVADPLSVAVLGGVRGGLVIVTADDPNCHSSANEQDNRFYGLFFKILTLEPSDPQEAKDLIVEAFSLSEKTALPVLLRTVTRVSHTRTNVVLGKIPKNNKQANFKRDPERFFITGSRALQRHQWQLQQQPLLESLVEGMQLNKLYNKGGEKKCIVTSGVAFNYVEDALRRLNTDEVAILKIASVYPLPKSLIKETLAGKETILVVEEGGPLVELQLKALAQELSVPVSILGKMSGDLPEAGELNIDIVAQTVSKLLGMDERSVTIRQDIEEKVKEILPPRTMTFCAGCPHAGTFYALKRVIRRRATKPFIAGDIGCYTLMSNLPYELGDVKYSMGAGIGVASGISKVLKEKAIAVIGDSTFIHAGIPGLINCAYNKSNITVIICDNRTTAMTGGQPHAGTGITATGQPTKELNLEEFVKGCGVEFVAVTDAYDVKGTMMVIERALAYDGVSVVISRRQCALEASREARRLGEKRLVYYVDPQKCTRCWLCLKQLSCPAIIKEDEKVIIDSFACTGCGLCTQVCPVEAIIPDNT